MAGKPAGKDEKKGPAPKKGKKQKVPYQKEGDGLVKKNKECPKCGSGVFMANHKDRNSCGKCNYTEFKK
jgi:small subunit ribosomal protein S27Ae